MKKKILIALVSYLSTLIILCIFQDEQLQKLERDLYLGNMGIRHFFAEVYDKGLLNNRAAKNAAILESVSTAKIATLPYSHQLMSNKFKKSTLEN